MNVSNVLPEQNQYDATSKKEDVKNKDNSLNTTTSETKEKNSNSDVAAVYTPASKEDNSTSSTSKIYTSDANLVHKLKTDAEQRTQQLKDLVEKLLVKQGETYNDSMNIFQLLREGKVEVDLETAQKAKEDISEDGYWGVKQTSERIYSFAIALTGGDPSKADLMLKAVETGYKEAAKIWGDDLPEICQQTLDTVKEKFSEWKSSNSISENESEDK